MKNDIPSQLSDDELVASVQSLVRCEREATASLVAHLAAAYNRIEAARAARRFPAILRMLGEGTLSLATVRLLASELTADNCREVLAAASGKSKRQVEELLVRYFPKRDVRPAVRALPVPKVPSGPSAATLVASPSPTALAAMASAPLFGASPPARRPVVSPLAPDRYEVRFTASAQTREKLRQAQDLLRHAIPTGDLAQVIDRALTALLEELGRKKFAATKRPRASRGTAPGSRDIAANVQRAVWLCDHGSCTFVSKNGRRCSERAFIEFHHVDPHGVGGEATCRAHNAYEAERFYGQGRPDTHSSREECATAYVSRAPMPQPDQPNVESRT